MKLLTNLMLIIVTINGAYGAIQTPQEQNKQIIRNFFDEMDNDPSVTEESAKKVIEKYLDPGYIQHVDGKTMHYKDSLPHRVNQLGRIKNIKITFDHLIAEGDKVISIHRAQGQKINGGEIEARVFALWRMKNGKIYLCDELTHLVKGSKEDEDIGSKH